MPRLTRLAMAGQAHHILQRGNNKQRVFFDDEGRRLYLRWLAEVADAEGCALHGYALMTNHVHLMMTPKQAESIPRVMQSLGRRYVGHVNRTHSRTGTLWEGRYKSAILDSEAYFLACLRYIEANPLRAAMVAQAEDYPWSSYRCHAFGEPNPALSPHELYTGLGSDPAERQAAYRALFAEGPGAETIETLRDATQRGWAPGSDRFRREIEVALGRAAGIPRRGRPPKKRLSADEAERQG